MTDAEVAKLTEAAKGNRYGHRDATMILLAYRHGFRAAELVDLRWDQIEGWSRLFDDEIALPDGGILRTLGDAGRYVAGLPDKVQHREEWQTAAEMLMLAAGGKAPIMFAHIGVLRALSAGEPEARPVPRRKAAKKYRIVR